MSRRRKNKEHEPLLESLIRMVGEILLISPWWVGPILACSVFAVLNYLLPWWFTPAESPQGEVGKHAAKMFSVVGGSVSRALAPWVTFLVTAMWIGAECLKFYRHRKLQTDFQQVMGVESLRALNWQEFEQIVGEAFRRSGYDVDHTGRDGPDGGLDLRLRRGHEQVIVQCKKWTREDVGVDKVRELEGVRSAEGAQRAIFATTSDFTEDARKFAELCGMELLNGDELAHFVSRVQETTKRPRFQKPLDQSQSKPGNTLSQNTVPAVSPACPRCGTQMVQRTATKGPNSGNRFWGCPRYPDCRGIRDFITK